MIELNVFRAKNSLDILCTFLSVALLTNVIINYNSLQSCSSSLILWSMLSISALSTGRLIHRSAYLGPAVGNYIVWEILEGEERELNTELPAPRVRTLGLMFNLIHIPLSLFLAGLGIINLNDSSDVSPSCLPGTTPILMLMFISLMTMVTLLHLLVFFAAVSDDATPMRYRTDRFEEHRRNLEMYVRARSISSFGEIRQRRQQAAQALAKSIGSIVTHNDAKEKLKYDGVCSICLEDGIEGTDDKLKSLPCMHVFHVRCINEWLTMCPDCPYCKQHFGQAEKIVDSLNGLDLDTLITSSSPSMDGSLTGNFPRAYQYDATDIILNPGGY
eukprot:GHVH01004043.1.p1 GENE.GHVH01004043.1~~GHVH01004043.1.p1  ORF type:complete len:330 (+),score=27.68 GHVH01004043.1:411-1400(+)